MNRIYFLLYMQSRIFVLGPECESEQTEIQKKIKKI